MAMYYSVTGHKFEITGGEPGFNIPGFSSFIIECGLPAELIMSIRLNERIVEKEAMLIYQFSMDTGTCQFLKNAGCYYIRWQQPNDIVWLMEIRPHDEGYIAFTNMNKYTDIHILCFSIWIAFGIAALKKQTVAIHASTLMYNNKSILFLGESGTGKSTQSQLWQQYICGTELLNDDGPFIRLNKDGIPIVWGSPWSGKTPCYKDKHTPIAAFIRLRQAPYNSIKRLGTLESIGALQPSLPPIFASEPVLAELVIECLSYLVQQIPVYVLDCLPNADAVDLVYSTLKRDGRL